LRLHHVLTADWLFAHGQLSGTAAYSRCRPSTVVGEGQLADISAANLESATASSRRRCRALNSVAKDEEVTAKRQSMHRRSGKATQQRCRSRPAENRQVCASIEARGSRAVASTSEQFAHHGRG